MANERPTPPKVVVWSLPFASAESSVLVALLKTVEELKVAVESNAMPPVNACNVVQVTLEAAVTKPGFIKLSVTAPVAFEAEIFVPEASEPTPITAPVEPLNDKTPAFWNWIAPPELAISMPVEVENVNGELKVNPAAAIVAVAGAEVM